MLARAARAEQAATPDFSAALVAAVEAHWATISKEHTDDAWHDKKDFSGVYEDTLGGKAPSSVDLAKAARDLEAAVARLPAEAGFAWRAQRLLARIARDQQNTDTELAHLLQAMDACPTTAARPTPVSVCFLASSTRRATRRGTGRVSRPPSSSSPTSLAAIRAASSRSGRGGERRSASVACPSAINHSSSA
jgi:hypothetical protein